MYYHCHVTYVQHSLSSAYDTTSVCLRTQHCAFCDCTASDVLCMSQPSLYIPQCDLVLGILVSQTCTTINGNVSLVLTCTARAVARLSHCRWATRFRNLFSAGMLTKYGNFLLRTGAWFIRYLGLRDRKRGLSDNWVLMSPRVCGIHT